jgi:hypothetical protein
MTTSSVSFSISVPMVSKWFHEINYWCSLVVTHMDMGDADIVETHDTCIFRI